METSVDWICCIIRKNWRKKVKLSEETNKIVDYHEISLLKWFGIVLLFTVLFLNNYSCNNEKNKLNGALKPGSINAASVEKESTSAKGNKNAGSSLLLTPLPLDSFGRGCGCIWWLPQDSSLKLFFAQNDINGEHPDIAIDNKKMNMNLKFIRLVEKEHGVEHIGDSVIQTWENERLIVDFNCVKTFTCEDDTSIDGSALCEVTGFRGILKITGKLDKMEKTYSILGDCGCSF